MTHTIDFPVYDADNHLYEPREALTRYLPEKYKRDFYFVEKAGRTKLVIDGKLSEFIPNPTFEVVARPGGWETWFRAENHEGLSRRELQGKGSPSARELADRQGPHRGARPAGRPRDADFPDAGLGDRRADRTSRRRDRRTVPFAQRMDGRRMELRAGGAPVRGALHQPHRHRQCGKGTRIRAVEGRKMRQHPSRTGRPHRGQPLVRPQGLRSVLGALRRRGHLRHAARIGQRL